MDLHINPNTGQWDDNWYSQNYGYLSTIEGGIPDTELEQLSKTDRNRFQEQRYQELLTQANIPFTVVDGKTAVNGQVFGNGTSREAFQTASYQAAYNKALADYQTQIPAPATTPATTPTPTEAPAEGTTNPTYDTILNAYNKQNEAFVAKLKEYDTTNPWVYDEILAEQTKIAGERLDPYYKQSLDDFLKGIETKRTRSTEDERRTLSEISQDIGDYTKENKLALEDALDKSREGYADAGLYSSGARMRSEGRLGYESQNQLQGYTTGQERRMGDVKLSSQRDMQDLGESQRLFQREVGQYGAGGEFTRGAQSEAEVRTQALGEIPRLQKEREFARRQYAGAPAGADEAEYWLNSYNLLA